MQIAFSFLPIAASSKQKQTKKRGGGGGRILNHLFFEVCLKKRSVSTECQNYTQSQKQTNKTSYASLIWVGWFKWVNRLSRQVTLK